MEFSEDWKTPWTISTVFSAPKLLRSGSTDMEFGPLQFSPYSSPHILASSTSLASPVNAPVARNVFLDDLHCYFRSVPDDFVPFSLHNELLPSLFPPNEDPIPTNRLQGLLFRDGTTVVLFFPTGENGHHVGYVALDLTGPVPKLLANDGDNVFEVGAGYRYPYHRITQIAVNPADADSGGDSVSSVEGYVLAASMYTVSWFKVESSEHCPGDPVKRPLVTSMGNQCFKSRVVHARWNPHFKEEMAVLLENGKLVHINVDTKRGVTFDVHTGGEFDCFLSCAFGGQPWVVMVASATTVMMVDLRSNTGDKPAVVARTQDLVHFTVPREIKNDRFIGFCRISFDHLYISVVTEYQLVLYDVRQPLYPILAWDHGIPHPSHISMHKLSELRPSEKFSWALDSGYAILLGSFWNDRFKLFCYGSMSEGISKTSSFYAWELPSSIPLSGRQCSSPADALRDEIRKHEDQTGVSWQMKEELILGFYIDPRSSLELKLKNHNFKGFGLIRLLSSGKLEFQRYCASSKHVIRKSSRKRMSSEIPDLPHHYWDYDDVVPRQLDYFKINFLTAYIDGTLFEAIIKGLDKPLSYGTNIKGLECRRDLWELINNMPRPTATASLSETLADASCPSSIHDIAMRRVLSSLPTNLLYLAFSNYQLIFDDLRYGFEFFEAPQLLHGKRLSHYFTRKPSPKVTCMATQNYLVGPALPVPVLLVLLRALHSDGIKAFQDCPEDNLLSWNCSLILEEKKNGPGLQGGSQETESKTPCFIFESPTDSSPNSKVPLKTNRSLTQSDSGPKDENFAAFISPSFTSDHRIAPWGASDGDLFDDSNQFRLDYESQEMNFSMEEHKVFQLLGRQFRKWRGTLPYYQEFCRDKKIKQNLL